jgi:hypothetical protein
MVVGKAHHTIRAPGKLVLTPTNFASGTYPLYGGTQLGLVKEVRLTPLGEAHHIEDEGLGETIDILEGDNRWLFSCFLRGWDENVLTSLFTGNQPVFSRLDQGAPCLRPR